MGEVARQGKIGELITKGGLKSDRHDLFLGSSGQSSVVLSSTCFRGRPMPDFIRLASSSPPWAPFFFSLFATS